MKELISGVVFIIVASTTLPVSAQEQSTFWVGKAPFCTAEPDSCAKQGGTYVRSHASGDGDTCITGVKVMCERKIANGASGKVLACPYNAKQVKRTLVCSCAANKTANGSIWGSGPYTADSSVCRAAVHAGVIRASGGSIRITKAPGQNSYRGSSANGVVTSSWKKYPDSFRISK